MLQEFKKITAEFHFPFPSLDEIAINPFSFSFSFVK